VCPNSTFGEREERIKGAYVMDPRPGVYDYVAVLDFKSLYPSIIRTYNIDPIAFRKGGPIKAPNGATFADSTGLLPQIIEVLGKERDIAKKEKDDVKSYAIKIIMNSFYGVLANPSCRFYSLDMGNAITSFARETIKETAKLIEDKGYRVLYGDTDSVFVDFKADSVKLAQKLGDEISRKVNKHFAEKINKQFGRVSHLELEFDKMFRVLMLPKMRGGATGAKKRYAGLLVKDGKEEIKATGMEIVRRDWTDLAKELQRELLDRVFHKKEVAKYIKRIVDELKEGKHDKKLVYRKSIRKSLDEYTKTTPPHVKAARMLPKLTSRVIEYYITKDGPVPVELMKGGIDYDHYLKKQIKPIADTILGLFGQNFDDIVKGTNQKSLFEY
jgi:DNA polymerase-2